MKGSPEKTPRLTTSIENNKSSSKLNITNSFGVPSLDSPSWQEDVKKALSYEKMGQLLILSSMGTLPINGNQKDFTEDHARVAQLANETGAKILEVNL